MEFQDGDFLCYSDDDSLPGTDFENWNKLFVEAADKAGRTTRPGRNLEKWVHEAGFEDVQHVKIPLPIGIWPKDQKMVSALMLWTTWVSD